MEKEFVPYELAVKLKAIGFDEHELCFAHWIERDERDGGGVKLEMWNDEDTYYEVKSLIKAPTFSQAFRWLLKEYNLYAIIIPTVTMHWTFKTMTVVEDIVEVPPYDHVDANDYGTREEAELACLVKLIEIVETRTK